jgi:hypothetical protein
MIKKNENSKRPKSTLDDRNKQISPAKKAIFNKAAIERAQDLIDLIKSEILTSLNHDAYDSTKSQEMERILA